MRIIWNISTTKTQNSLFKNGGLISRWANAHPEIFDEDEWNLDRLANFKNLETFQVMKSGW